MPRPSCATVQLWELFGFGCDHEQRAELLRMGAERGAVHLGAPLRDRRVVVIGDTARDVVAAQAIGAECVEVETGGVSDGVLLAAGPCSVFHDLTDSGVLDRLLG